MSDGPEGINEIHPTEYLQQRAEYRTGGNDTATIEPGDPTLAAVQRIEKRLDEYLDNREAALRQVPGVVATLTAIVEQLNALQATSHRISNRLETLEVAFGVASARNIWHHEFAQSLLIAGLLPKSARKTKKKRV